MTPLGDRRSDKSSDSEGVPQQTSSNGVHPLSASVQTRQVSSNSDQGGKRKLQHSTEQSTEMEIKAPKQKKRKVSTTPPPAQAEDKSATDTLYQLLAKVAPEKPIRISKLLKKARESKTKQDEILEALLTLKLKKNSTGEIILQLPQA